MTFFADKETLNEMLTVSYEDYKNWEKSHKLSYLRDAANKLVAVAENLTSTKLLKPISNYGEFRHCFLQEYKNHELFLKLDMLHKFFYEGIGYEGTPKDIEYTYHKARKELMTLVKKLPQREKREKNCFLDKQRVRP